VPIRLRLGNGSRCLGGALAVVIDFGAFAERTTRGAWRASGSWGGVLAEFDALNNRVRGLSKEGQGKGRTLVGGSCSSSEESTTSEADFGALGES
jgi:hypothetical protein